MRFLVDECTGPKVSEWLRSQGHEVFCVYHQARGLADDDIIAKAYREHWILITSDKGFGEGIYREQKPHGGVLLLRLEDERNENKISVLRRILSRYGERLPDSFTVATEKRIRFAPS